MVQNCKITKGQLNKILNKAKLQDSDIIGNLFIVQNAVYEQGVCMIILSCDIEAAIYETIKKIEEI